MLTVKAGAAGDVAEDFAVRKADLVENNHSERDKSRSRRGSRVRDDHDWLFPPGIHRNQEQIAVDGKVCRDLKEFKLRDTPHPCVGCSSVWAGKCKLIGS